MKMPVIAKAMSELDDDLILESNYPSPKRRFNFRPLVMVMTCMIFVFFIGNLLTPSPDVVIRPNHPLGSNLQSQRFFEYHDAKYVINGSSEEISDEYQLLEDQELSQYLELAIDDKMFISSDEEIIYIYTAKYSYERTFVKFIKERPSEN